MLINTLSRLHCLISCVIRGAIQPFLFFFFQLLTVHTLLATPSCLFPKFQMHFNSKGHWLEHVLCRSLPRASVHIGLMKSKKEEERDANQIARRAIVRSEADQILQHTWSPLSPWFDWRPLWNPRLIARRRREKKNRHFLLLLLLCLKSKWRFISIWFQTIDLISRVYQIYLLADRLENSRIQVVWNQ